MNSKQGVSTFFSIRYTPFLKGASSILNIKGNFYWHTDPVDVFRKSPNQALKEDWSKVESDFYIAFDKIKNLAVEKKK